MRNWARLALAISLFVCCNAWATALITIGQVAPLDTSDHVGPDLALGATVWFDAVNAAGGVNGAQLRLVSRNRGLDPKDAVTVARRLIAEVEPLALLGLMGTGPMRALVKDGVLQESEIPVVGIRTGATGLHVPVNPYLFHTRANYAEEIERIVELFSRMGMGRIAVVYENSAFGKEGLAQADAAIGRNEATLAAKGSFEANSSDVSVAFKTIVDAAPQSVIMISGTDAAADFYRRWRASGYIGQVAVLSTVDGAAVVKELGQETARGLGVAAVVPDPRRRILPVCREFLRNMEKFAPSGTEPNAAMLEGYIAAKVLVEGIRRAGINPSRKRLRTALETINDYDVGGLVIHYSPGNHSGSSFVNVGILDKKGAILF